MVRLLWIGSYCILLGLMVGLLLAAQPAPALMEVRISAVDSSNVIARFEVEIADEPGEWQRGLMERPFLAHNRGMLFIFPEQAPRVFWMMNTLIHLDIIFADAEGRILNIAANVPPCAAPRRCPTYRSIAPARYVLEIPGGHARTLGVRPGGYLHFDAPQGGMTNR
jgi:uncharacterized membrane protein (UPF0127 family)